MSQLQGENEKNLNEGFMDINVCGDASKITGRFQLQVSVFVKYTDLFCNRGRRNLSHCSRESLGGKTVK